MYINNHEYKLTINYYIERIHSKSKQLRILNDHLISKLNGHLISLVSPLRDYQENQHLITILSGGHWV